MASNRLAFVFLGVACVAAAGGGSYFATRHNVTRLAVPAASAGSIVSADSTAAADSPATAASGLPAPAIPAQERPAAKTPNVQRVDAEPARSVAKPASTPLGAPESSGRTAVETPTVARVTEAHTQERNVSPATATTNPPTPAAPPADATPATPPVEERSVELPRTPEAPARTFQELVVSADSVIGLQTEGLLSSERARVEDRVEAHMVRDVHVGGEVAIPAGTRALGSVVVVERGGRVRQPARLGIRFHTLVMADGTRLPITTETIFRVGDAPGNGSAAKIGGGAVAGAILGAIIGGGKGAAIGATTGAGAGAAAVMTGDRSAATFPPGSEVTARILSPVTVTIERD